MVQQESTLPEQVIATELAYYQQMERLSVSPEDKEAWQELLELYHFLEVFQPEQESVAFKRFALERHGYSLHRYMAEHLSVAAWKYWFEHGGLLIPFR